MAIDNFGPFRDAVAKHIAEMSRAGELFYVDVDKDTLWDTYLSAFPEGTNPIFKEKTEHDCNCCKSFIRAVGGLVTIRDGVVTSVWELVAPEFYQDVADALATVVLSSPIKNVFRSDIKPVGNKVTYQHSDLNLRMDIVKHIIDVRMAEAEAAEKAQKDKAREHKILEILAKKEDEDLENMSKEDLEALLNKQS